MFMRQEGGFSSLELIILLACLGIMAAAAVPRPYSLISLELDYEAARLAGELRWLQGATQSSHPVHQNFRSLGGIATPVMTLKSHGYSISEGTNNIRPHQCPADMWIDTDRTTILFGRNGNGMPATIRLYYKGQSRTIRIDLAGRVRVGLASEE